MKGRKPDKWKKMMLIVYNDESVGNDESLAPLPMKDCFHVTLDIDSFEGTFDEWLEAFIKPAFNCIHSRMIPDMPDSSDPKFLEKLMEWETRYYGPIEDVVPDA